MLKFLGMLYIDLAFQMIVHELGHMFAAILLHMKVEQVCFGHEKFLTFTWKKVKLSPLCMGGFVEVESESLQKRNTFEKLLFFEAGACCNGIVCLISLLFFHSMESFVLFVVGILYILGSNNLFVLNSDINNFLKSSFGNFSFVQYWNRLREYDED